MPPRQSSVPCERPGPSRSTTENPIKDTNNATVAPPQDSPGNAKSHLVSRAEAVARAMIEISLHRIVRQVEGQEKNLKALCVATADNEEFRAKNEKRLSEVYREIRAVREHYKAVHERQTTVNMDITKLQAEADEIRKELGCEIASLRADLLQASKQLEILAPARKKTSNKVDNKVKEKVNDKVNEKDDRSALKASKTTAPPMTPTNSPEGTVGERIKQFISRTRDWHHARKRSEIPEATFYASYFHRQGKHDPSIAKLVQRAVLRRVSSRSESGAPKPKNLQELCGVLTWDDITDTVEDVLIFNEEKAVKALT